MRFFYILKVREERGKRQLSIYTAEGTETAWNKLSTINAGGYPTDLPCTTEGHVHKECNACMCVCKLYRCTNSLARSTSVGDTAETPASSQDVGALW